VSSTSSQKSRKVPLDTLCFSHCEGRVGLIQVLPSVPALTEGRGRCGLWDLVLVDVKRLKYFADLACAVELSLIDSLTLMAGSVPLFVLCCSVGMQQFCLCGVPARSGEKDQRQIHSHRSSGHGIEVFLIL